MSRMWFTPDYGWLMYSGNGTLFGRVAHLNLSVEAPMISVSSISSPYAMQVPGPTEITVTATMASLVRDEVLWNGKPPDLKALLALARRHPEEYEELREGEAIMKALGG